MTLRASPVLAQAYDLALLDLDGTVYRGAEGIPGAAAAVCAAVEIGMRCRYLTNNASRTADEVAEHLRALGLPAEPDSVVTSSQAAAGLLAAELGPGARVLVVGGHGLWWALEQVGLVPVASADDDPVAVAQGFAREVGWEMLAEGAFAIRRGLPWVATNGDLTLPLPRGLAPGNGALVAALRAATGATPRFVGKPERPLVDEGLRGVDAARPLMVGDRLDTDIECALRAGLPSLLVLTGVCRPLELLAAEPAQRPTYVSRDLDGLLQPHPAVERTSSRWSCGEWTAAIVDDALALRRGDDSGDSPSVRRQGRDGPLDALRAACAAAWEAADAGQPVALDPTALAPAFDEL